MKNIIKVIATFAGAVMLGSTLPVAPVSAETWTLVDEGTEIVYQDMIPVDDKGIFSNVTAEGTEYQVYLQPYTDYHVEEVTDPATGEVRTERIYTERCRVIQITPIKNTLWFILRPDKPDAEAQMLEIMERYYPGISESFTQRTPNEYASLRARFYILNDGTSTGPHKYELRDLTESAGSQERSDSIMHDLAKAGLITEFYTWGQGAYGQQYFGWLSYGQYYLEPIQNYLAEHAPNCTLNGGSLVPDESMSYAERFALVADIYEATGVRPAVWTLDEILSAMGQNALAITGDATLDCAVDVADAVLIARFCAEDEEAVITAQGKANADYNADGNITQDDVMLILKKIARLI